MVTIRPATPSDAKGILNIYAPHVQQSFCTFESDVPSVEEMQERIKKIMLTKPWLVCTIDKSIAAYVYASAHRERTAYQWSCECSVYTNPDFQNTGLVTSCIKSYFKF
jgi:phosphinothricin acetyltransferase